MQIFAEHRRCVRYDEIYFSPHLDDVVYSCGGRITQQRRAGRKVLVVTVFGDDTQPPTSPVAYRYGDFRTRREEDCAALARLDADHVWFNHPDYLFRRPSTDDKLHAFFPFLRLPESTLLQEVTQDLLELCATSLAEGGRLSFPLAVGFHPDHRIVCDAGRAMHALGRHRVEFYEDVPYSHFPVLLSLRLRALGLPAATPFWRSTRELSEALVLFFGMSPTPTFLQTLCYFPLLSALELVSGAQDRFPDESPPVRLREARIEDVIDDKVAAVRLYPSQTEVLLAMDDRLYGILGSPSGFVERSWSFPPVGPSCTRLRRLGLHPLDVRERAHGSTLRSRRAP